MQVNDVISENGYPPLAMITLRSVQAIMIITSLMIIFTVIGRAILHKRADFEKQESYSVFFGSIVVLPPLFAAIICIGYKYSRDKLLCFQNPLFGLIFFVITLFIVMFLIALIGHYVCMCSPYTVAYVDEEMMIGFVVFSGFLTIGLLLGYLFYDISHSNERLCGARWWQVRTHNLYLCLATTMPCYCCWNRPLPSEEPGIDIMDIDFNNLELGGGNVPPANGNINDNNDPVELPQYERNFDEKLDD